MAKKISQLTQATQVKSDDVTVIVQDGETKKLPLNMMVTKQDIENKKVAGLAKLDEIEATYENDTYTPTIAVKNKSSVKVGEGDGVDYSANVMDGHVKSAILKGQTLVNYFNPNTISELPDEGFLLNEPDFSRQRVFNYIPLQPYEDNTEYTVIVWLKDVVNPNNVALLISFGNIDLLIKNFKNGINIAKGTIKTISGNPNIRIANIRIGNVDVLNGAGATLIGAVILKGDYTTISLNSPFYGMQSVKMPVLTTTGKNLCDNTKLSHGFIDGNGVFINIKNNFRTDYMSIKPNTNYISKSHTYPNGIPVYCWFDENKKLINRGTDNLSPINARYLIVFFNNSQTNVSEYVLENIFLQVEEGLNSTSYEPFKSNILTVNEPVELRGIDDVRDELNVVNGELTQRIGEIVLDGSENYSKYTSACETVYGFSTKLITNSSEVDTALCDKLPVQRGKSVASLDEEGIFFRGDLSVMYLKISKSKLSDGEPSTLKAWLAENNVTFAHQLKENVIKTVDLMPSGTHPSTTPYCWKNGHIQLSSSGLLPSLEYSVVTSRAGQINQNATMIVKNDKRIFDLEILLAGGLVNTTYQALTLQNQVETGLSKVSLNSETEPDYLLYHMIMKLIEEKAYKLDDLTEKVSVFYLYEKLSDEQFETIYSALYPFVEDEIVEEPVVEELPEVVEDEVIM